MEVGEQARVDIQRTVCHVDRASAAVVCIVIGRKFTVAQRRPRGDVENARSVVHIDQAAVFGFCDFHTILAAAVQHNLGQCDIAAAQREALFSGSGCRSVDGRAIPHTNIGEVCIILARRGQYHRLIRERYSCSFLDGVLIYKLLHSRWCGRDLLVSIRKELIYIGVKGLIRFRIVVFSEIPIYGGSAVCIIQQISIRIRDLKDTADKGDRAIIVNSVNSKSPGITVSVGIVCGVRCSVICQNHQLCPVRHMKISGFVGCKVKARLSARIGGDAVGRIARILIKGIVRPGWIIVCQRHGDSQPSVESVLYRHSTGVRITCPKRVERKGFSHRSIFKIIELSGDILTFCVCRFRKLFIRCPSEKRNFLRWIDGIGHGLRYLLPRIHSLLIDFAVAVTILISFHFRRPGTAVDVKADQWLLGKGDDGILHTVA